MRPIGVAVVGCGTISDEYLRNMTSFPDLNVVFCADMDVEPGQDQGGRSTACRTSATRPRRWITRTLSSWST